ncbi:UDP-glucosyltransferase 2-like isoform X1 [Lutzomyia longipalpis]|uniref:UDP-glucosyltransferase 2-like isoform X1 n=1 Tax=Lutzomyia longipalpis TaxID=7200 RepID=UPI002483DF5E|nr:UDP-glucosyltransferase 2-like isoform X1 [Lutzomyia longipalpis]
MKLFALSFLVFGGFSLIFGANILVLEGLPSPSHHVLFSVVNRALAARGHNVTSISADIDQKPKANLTYLHLDRVYETLYADGDINLIDIGKVNPLMTFVILAQLILKTFSGVQKSSGYKQLLNYPDDFEVDLVIYDFIACPLLLGFMHKFNNPPLIGLTGYNAISQTSTLLGSPYHSAFVPHHCRLDDQNGFLKRVGNYVLHWLDYFLRKYFILPKIEAGLRKDLPDLPSLAQLEETARIAMINYHPVFEPAEPMLPGVIGIAGLQIMDPKPLPEDLAKLAADRGFIFFSLGTNTQPEWLGEERLRYIVEAIGELKEFTFFWKVKGKLEIHLPTNLVQRPWFPQSDLLAHPNAKLFISHCGLLSTHEATWRGVPILGVPIILDQFMNTIRAVKAGMALEYDIRNVKKETFKAAILEMITNPKYKENAMIRSKLFRDQPEKPLDRAIWWIEYVLRNPNENIFKSETLEMNIFQRHDVDIVVFLFSVLIVLLYVSYRITVAVLRKIWRSLMRDKRKKD